MKFNCTFLLLLFSALLFAQGENKIAENSFAIDDLSQEEFVNFIRPKIAQSQFIFLGEQHGIVEVGETTSLLYDWAQPFGYQYLCIETDAVAAKRISSFFKTEDPLAAAKNLDQQFKFSIPFYNNYEDQKMFENVMDQGGQLWGIDQTLMSQFRLNFFEIHSNTSDPALKSKVNILLDKAKVAFEKAVSEKDFQAPFIFQYDQATHEELLNLSIDDYEREIIHQLWKTKEIYSHYFNGQYYLNNEVRGRLMKSNFMRYYRQAQKKEATPKVIFKLGANHAARGLTRTRIYDIANMGAELAIMNEMESLHLVVMGISGTMNVANPFEPDKATLPINAAKQVPEELLEVTNDSDEKYQVFDFAALRPFANKLSKPMQKLIFQYDVGILIKNARPLKSFP